MPNAILLISCPDKKGIIANLSNFIYKYNGNIENLDQHIDYETNTFFTRIEWNLKNFKLNREEIPKNFSKIANNFKMKFSLDFTDNIINMVVFSSKFTHCLYDIILRYKEGQFKVNLPFIISIHPNTTKVAKIFDIPVFEFKINDKNRLKVEKEQLALLKKENINLIVLARYTRILSKQFINNFKNKIINIHHSFLPAFIGNNPYEQAYARGVKIIGATSHYVTYKLDAGPIIEQDIIRVSHKDTLKDLKRKGKDLEKLVLSRAIRWHLERKILVYNNKTVIFD